MSASSKHETIAYFSMEIAFDPTLPTYSGGLGVLAGDILRSCADLALGVVGVTLVYRRGHFRQRLEDGQQREENAAWQPERTASMRDAPARVAVEIEGRVVWIRAWETAIAGRGGHVTVLCLDTNLPENDPNDREITATLYGGDARMRLAQEIVLGRGGIKMLRALGYAKVAKVHANEGHAALAFLELLHDHVDARGMLGPGAFEAVRRLGVLTTHTPVAAGHDRFGGELACSMLSDVPDGVLQSLFTDGVLDMTRLAIRCASYVNAVSRVHRDTTARLFPDVPIAHVTNGVHTATWLSPAMAALFDARVPDWRDDPSSLRHAVRIPAAEIGRAHAASKAKLLETIAQRTGRILQPERLTLGFARRATGYKRAWLVLDDLERLRAIARKYPIQLVFSGKAHPRDEEGKQIIARLVRAAQALGDDVPLVYLADYDMALARELVAGADVWLNTPRPPLEASGTSGMKAAMNGVPSLSTLDGWWVEGHVEGVTGWKIEAASAGDDHSDARALYDQLENVIAPMFFERRAQLDDVRRNALALCGSFFHTHRVVQQYATEAYLR